MPRKLIMCGDHPVLAFEYDPESGRACSSGEVLDHDRLPLEFTTHGKSALYAKRIDEWWRCVLASWRPLCERCFSAV